jgi:nicotinate-nucleotide adenylyltransferase
MKIAILGGSFNPVHMGHIVLADSVCNELGYDKVLFVPALTPPHKEMGGSASPQDRLAMVHAAIAGDPRFEAEPCEIERGGISYTYDTVLYLQKKYDGRLTAKIGVVLGTDLYADYGKWNHAEELSETADLILARRPSGKNSCSAYEAEAGQQDDECKTESSVSVENHPVGAYDHPQTLIPEDTFAYPHKTLVNPELGISSTDIRARIASGKQWSSLVPEPVFHYIVERSLYGYRTV